MAHSSPSFLLRLALLSFCSVLFIFSITFFLGTSSSPSSSFASKFQSSIWEVAPSEEETKATKQEFKLPKLEENVDESFDELLLAKLPPSTQLDNEQTFALVEKISNLAMFYWKSWQKLNSTFSTSTLSVNFCPSINLTSPMKLRQVNRFWQTFDSLGPSKITINLLNAYYDRRPEKGFLEPKIRILGVTKEAPAALDGRRKWHCLLWFEQFRDPVLIQAFEYHNIFPRQWQPHVESGTYHPALISCPIPAELQNLIPAAVSLVNSQRGNQCADLKEPSNVLRVLNFGSQSKRNLIENKKPSFGVCVQALRFATYEQSVRLIEWLEWMRLLGANKVYLYVLGLTENLRKVLNSYSDDGLLDWREYTLPGEQPNLGPLYNLAAYHLFMHFWPQELIELNDCLYRNLDRHDYLAVIDIDEVIMPQKKGVKDWRSLLENLEKSIGEREFCQKAFYNSRQSHVCEVFEEENSKITGNNIPSYFYTLRHRRRGKPLEFNKQNKCIVRPSHVFTLHNHFPINCLNGSKSVPLSCDGLTFDPEDSVLLHFRRNISNPKFAYRNWDCPLEEGAMFSHEQALKEKVRLKLVELFG